MGTDESKFHDFLRLISDWLLGVILDKFVQKLPKTVHKRFSITKVPRCWKFDEFTVQ